MRKLAFAALAICIFAPHAHAAEKLHPIFLGQWCSNDGETYMRGDDCGVDGRMTIEPRAVRRHEERCRLLSIRSTGRKTPASTKPTKADWIPVMRAKAQCSSEDGQQTVTLEFEYWKAILTVKRP